MLLSENIDPFRINIPQSDLDDLNERLDRTRWPDEIPGAGWDYGIPGDYLRELAQYWRHAYDWRAAEARLNAWPQFTTGIDGANIHFAHVRSPEPDATPLLLTHGWPGSIVEFTEVVGPLTDPAAHGGDPADAFHVVLPSIPGFGLSGPTRERGWEFRRVAAAFAELMDRLGYRRYGVQGGDWGAAISREIGRTRPEVIGVHLNLIPNSYMTREPDDHADLSGLPPEQAQRTRESWERFQEWARDKQGYADIQSTRPQTLAYGLTDSPVGQLAWISEKFHEWTDEPVDRDLLLTNVMLYWLTGTAGFLGPHLLRAGPRRLLGLTPRTLAGTHRPRPLPARELRPAAPPRRADEQHRPVDRPRPRRPLRGHGTAPPPGRRHPDLLPLPLRARPWHHPGVPPLMGARPRNTIRYAVGGQLAHVVPPAPSTTSPS